MTHMMVAFKTITVAKIDTDLTNKNMACLCKALDCRVRYRHVRHCPFTVCTYKYDTVTKPT